MSTAIDTEYLKQLHDLATLGIPLTQDERILLEAWYKQEDEYEARLLHQNATSDGAVDLRAKIAEASRQLRIAVERTQMLLSQNEVLRQEIRMLQGQLASSQIVRYPSAQPT